MIWITDFGLAKSEGSATLTRTGETVGTPRYMAPEAFSGWTDPRSDVWGVGATLYEMLAGCPAFDGNDRARLLKQISDVEPTPLQRVDPAIPRDLATIVHKCLQKEPAARYASARELADDLRRFLDGEPIRARPPSLAYRIGLVRRNHPVASLLLFGALAAGTVMTSLEAMRARAAEKRADRRFDDVRRLANSFLFEFHDAIRNLPGSTPARALVVKRALEYLESLAAESADDPGLRRELAAAYQKVGDVQGNPYQPNLGDVAGARKSYTTAIELLEPLVAARDASDEDRALLASACLVVGGIDVVTNSKHAVAMSQRGLELRQAIAAHDPSPARRMELATAFQYFAFSLSADGRQDEAFDALRQQATILRALLAAAPDDASLRRSWGANRNLVAHALEHRKDDAGAKEAYVESVDLRRALLAADPANTSLQRDLAWALTDLANLQERAGAWTAALTLYSESLQICRSLAAADPDSINARLGVEVAQINLGDVLIRLHEPAEALEHLAAAIELGEAIVAGDPGDAWAERLLATANYNSAEASVDLGDAASLRHACDYYSRTLEILERMKAAGRLRNSDDPMFEQVRQALAACKARLDK